MVKAPANRFCRDVKFDSPPPVKKGDVPAMRLFTPALVACMLATLSASITASARVGETQEEFERRLLQPAIGKFIPREKNPDPAREEEILRQQPFNQVRVHFPDGIRERKYWKSAVPNVLSNDNGWRVHVFFHDNVSVLEAYQRVGDSMNEFEIQNILRANQGTSEWQRVEPDSIEATSSVIGCDYQLADGTLRARVVKGWLIVYSVKLDDYVKEQLRVSEEKRRTQEEERVRQQQSSAPNSTSGF